MLIANLVSVERVALDFQDFWVAKDPTKAFIGGSTHYRFYSHPLFPSIPYSLCTQGMSGGTQDGLRGNHSKKA